MQRGCHGDSITGEGWSPTIPKIPWLEIAREGSWGIQAGFKFVVEERFEGLVLAFGSLSMVLKLQDLTYVFLHSIVEQALAIFLQSTLPSHKIPISLPET